MTPPIVAEVMQRAAARRLTPAPRQPLYTWASVPPHPPRPPARCGTSSARAALAELSEDVRAIRRHLEIQPTRKAA